MHDRDHRLSLIDRIAATLRAAGILHVLIGASALAARGVPRSTTDQDLFTVDPRCLDRALWADLRASGVGIEIRKGDSDDPLAGVVRCEAAGELPVDLVVGKSAWQVQVLEKAERRAGRCRAISSGTRRNSTIACCARLRCSERARDARAL